MLLLQMPKVKRRADAAAAKAAAKEDKAAASGETFPFLFRSPSRSLPREPDTNCKDI